ncbi:TRAP transporter small permease [Candidatus Albibeggiatoa sp. nov. NOAA]|uniref:TRAP transporter small permease n=1 Tax=Candidatus Albibeggiatoa sp. nov. NOAA TaxID=3162724 RepID=UPI0032FC5DD4|nr:TRAP transporter small permease [Thiotrichaceae bacterium]
MKLDWLYKLSGVAAAILLVCIALLIIAQIVTRFIGQIVPDANEIAGYCMAGSTFLALAYTLRAGGHIRVTMIINHLPKAYSRLLEIFTLGVASFLTGYFAYYLTLMVWQTYEYGEVSQGHIPMPLWIPQSTLAIGMTILCLAFIEEFIRAAQGKELTYQDSPH